MPRFERHIPLSLGTGTFGITATTTSSSYSTDSKALYANIDVADYTSASYFFEAVLKTSAGTAYAQLYDLTSAAAISGSEVSTTATSNTRIRSSEITLLTAKNYTVQYKNSASNTTTYYGSKVIAIQDALAIEKTEVQYAVINYPPMATTGSSYIDPTIVGTSHFLWTAANWDGTLALYLDATIKVSAGTGGTARLTNIANTAVSGSDCTTTSTSLVRVRSSAFTLTDATAYKVRIISDGANTFTLNGALIVIKQTGFPTKTEAILPVSVTAHAQSGSGGSYQDANGRLYYDPANWVDVTATWYHDNTAHSNIASGSQRVYNITAAGVLTNSANNNTNTGASTRYRSSAVTMPVSASLLREEGDSGAGTVYVGQAHLIGVMSWVNISTGGMFLQNLA